MAFWALVDSDGTLAKAKGVLANYHDSTGHYRIIFRRNLDRCVPIAPLKLRPTLRFFFRR
jgi:hypothetical protein